jgi:hypothetical protein
MKEIRELRQAGGRNKSRNTSTCKQNLNGTLQCVVLNTLAIAHPPQQYKVRILPINEMLGVGVVPKLTPHCADQPQDLVLTFPRLTGIKDDDLGRRGRSLITNSCMRSSSEQRKAVESHAAI